MMLSPESLSSIQSKSAAFVIVQSINHLAEQLHLCSQEKFTGQLDLKIQNSQTAPWSLYYQMGHLVWGSGGTHPIRRWRRQLSQHRSLLAIASTNGNESSFQQWNYDSLATLLKQGKIQQPEMAAIARGLTIEIFFDLFQEWSWGNYANLHLKFNYVHPSAVQPTFVGISISETRSQALQDWKAWQQAGLEEYSPNQSPTIRDAKALQQQVQPTTYQNLASVMEGQRTLRDLAVKSNKSVLTVTKSFLPYVQQGLIQLLDIEDVLPAVQPKSVLPRQLAAATPTRSVQPTAPLIVYIDDYQEDGQTMNQILNQMGFRCMHVQDPMQALPLLLDHKPSLIFLDLVMPVINGYEACAQIRRISRFKETPVIILTSSDGIIDRVRAKIVGSTDFLAKPIKPKKVQAIVQKYLVLND